MIVPWTRIPDVHLQKKNKLRRVDMFLKSINQSINQLLHLTQLFLDNNNCDRDISFSSSKHMKLENYFISLGRIISSTEMNVNIRIIKAWDATDCLTSISDSSDKIKQMFFKAAA